MHTPSQRKRRIRAPSIVSLCALLIASASCRDDAVTAIDRVASMEVTPAATTVPVGMVMELTAEAKDERGQPVPGQQVHWSSSDTTVAVVSDAGVVSARSAGEVQIAATVQGVSAVALIRVAEAPPSTQTAVTHVVVLPGVALVRSSGKPEFRRITFTATALDADGQVVPGRQFTWTTSENDVATVSSGGVVTGRSPGVATITATTAGIKGTAAVLVIK